MEWEAEGVGYMGERDTQRRVNSKSLVVKEVRGYSSKLEERKEMKTKNTFRKPTHDNHSNLNTKGEYYF